jgi:hypothetical protein
MRAIIILFIQITVYCSDEFVELKFPHVNEIPSGNWSKTLGDLNIFELRILNKVGILSQLTTFSVKTSFIY